MTDHSQSLAWAIIVSVSVSSAVILFDLKFGRRTLEAMVNLVLVTAVGLIFLFAFAWAVWTVCGGGT